MKYFEYAEFDINIDFFFFKLKIIFLGKFDPKNIKIIYID